MACLELDPGTRHDEAPGRETEGNAIILSETTRSGWDS